MDEALALLLARHDALWLPILASDGRGADAIWEARRKGLGAYAGGIGGDGATRVKKTRTNEALIAAGLARRVGRETALTPAGVVAGRRLTWEFSYNQLAKAIDRLQIATSGDDYAVDLLGGRWVPENVVSGETDILAGDTLQALLLPVLAAGAVVSGHCGNIVFYQLIDPAVDLAKLVDPSASPDEVDDDLADLHWQEIERVRDKLTAKYDGSEIAGSMTLSVGQMQNARNYADVGPFEPLFQPADS